MFSEIDSSDGNKEAPDPVSIAIERVGELTSTVVDGTKKSGITERAAWEAVSRLSPRIREQLSPTGMNSKISRLCTAAAAEVLKTVLDEGASSHPSTGSHIFVSKGVAEGMAVRIRSLYGQDHRLLGTILDVGRLGMYEPHTRYEVSDDGEEYGDDGVLKFMSWHPNEANFLGSTLHKIPGNGALFMREELAATVETRIYVGTEPAAFIRRDFIN